MQFIRISVHIGILYMFYVISIWIQQTFCLFIPGGALGMILFFILLFTGVFDPRWVEAGAGVLIKHLPLLFLPITVGVINYLDLFKGYGIWIIIIALVSTALVMFSGGFVSQLLYRKEKR